MTKKAAKTKSMDFESSVKELEKIITKMESGKLSLDEGLQSFEQGIQLTSHCRELLSAAEQKIQILVQEQEEKFEDFDLNSEYDEDLEDEDLEEDE